MCIIILDFLDQSIVFTSVSIEATILHDVDEDSLADSSGSDTDSDTGTSYSDLEISDISDKSSDSDTENFYESE